MLGFGFRPAAERTLFSGDHACFQGENRRSDDLGTLPLATVGKRFETVSPTFNDQDAQLKAVLPRMVWDQLEESIKAEFNRRLRNLGQKSGRWLKKGQVPYRPYPG